MADSPSIDPRIVLAVDRSIQAYRGRRKVGREKLLRYTEATLSFLAERANQGRRTNYSEVSSALGLGNAQWGNVAFGSVNRILKIVESEHIFGAGLIPDITAIVTQKGKSTFGRGLLLGHKEIAGKSRGEQLSDVEILRQEAFRWPFWMQLLALLGLKALANLSPDDDGLTRFASQPSPRGKSPEHLNMQDCICGDPKLAAPNLQGEIESSHCEYLFWSLDRADVVTRTTEEWIGFEVKPKGSPFEELKKGIHQVVKYRALIAADLLSRGLIRPSRCVLVIGGYLPKELRELTARLGIEVVENFRCPVRSP